MRQPEPSHPTSIRLRPALKSRLREIAAKQRWTLAETIINALEDWVAQQKRKRK